MRKLRWIVGGFVALVLIAGLGWFVVQRIGPTATGPTEDPVVRLNREHGSDAARETAERYAAAGALITPAPLKDWEQWATPGPEAVPAELVAWVAANTPAFEEARAAAAEAECWFPLQRDLQGMLTMQRLSDVRALTRLLALRARLAADRHDLDDLGSVLETGGAMARHVLQQPWLLDQLVGFAILTRFQDYVVLPFGWPGVSAEQRAAYSDRIASLFAPPPSLKDALDVEQEFCAWEFSSSINTKAASRVFALPARYYGELDVRFAPLRALAAQPPEEQANPANPLNTQIANLAQARPTVLNFSGMLAAMTMPALTRVFEVRTRCIATQRGNRTVLLLFTERDRTGAFPENLDALRADWRTDPYSGRPFVYRRTDDSFTLYSVGIDRDDDGGRHDRRFGESATTGGQPAVAPDGDFVFWPRPVESRGPE